MIPVYNELDHLETFLAQIDRASFGIPKKLVFVDDCSSHGPRELLERYPFKSETVRIRHDTNHGKGAALQAGIAAASGTIICIQGSDNEYDLDDLARLIVPILTDKADVVCGSRFRQSTHTVQHLHYLANARQTMIGRDSVA